MPCVQHKPVIDIYKRFKSCIAHIKQSFDGISDGKDLLRDAMRERLVAYEFESVHSNAQGHSHLAL